MSGAERRWTLHGYDEHGSEWFRGKAGTKLARGESVEVMPVAAHEAALAAARQVDEATVDALCEAASPGFGARMEAQVGLHGLLETKKRVRAALLREAAQTLLDVAAVVGAGPSEFDALRAALASTNVEQASTGSTHDGAVDRVSRGGSGLVAATTAEPNRASSSDLATPAERSCGGGSATNESERWSTCHRVGCGHGPECHGRARGCSLCECAEYLPLLDFPDESDDRREQT